MLKLSFSGHCVDSFGATLYEEGKEIKNYNGYVLECLGGGDDIDLEIDVNTGQILNWKAPTKEELIEDMSR